MLHLEDNVKTKDYQGLATDLKSTAINLHKRGFNVLPLKPQSKKPSIQWTKFQDTQISRNKLLSEIKPKSNLGVVTGQVSNLLVVDLDSQDAIRWYYEQFSNLPPVTPAVRTSRGIHVYYKYPSGLDISKVELRDKVEIFGNGHQVCLPPSLHPSGRKYEWLNNPLEVELAKLPQWLKSTLREYGSTSQNVKEHHSVSSKSTKSLEKPRKVDTSTQTIKDLLNHKVFSGKAKSGSCNGRYLSHLITGFRLDLDKAKAIQATKNKYPKLDKSTIKDSARTVYQQGYGLSPAKMIDLGIKREQAESLYKKLLEVTGGYCEVEHTTSYQSREEFNINVFKASLALTLTGTHHTTYERFSEFSGVSQSTLAHKDRKELPQFVEIKSINGKGIVVYNYLPIFLTILAQLAKYLCLHTALNTTPLQNSYSSWGVVSGSSEIKSNKSTTYQDSSSIKIRGSPN